MVPDLTFLIDMPVEIGLSRISRTDADRLERESMEFHEKVRKGFLEIAEIEKERYIVVDGYKSIEEIHKFIIEKFVNFQIKRSKNV